jgi:hypothetical protein
MIIRNESDELVLIYKEEKFLYTVPKKKEIFIYLSDDGSICFSDLIPNNAWRYKTIQVITGSKFNLCLNRISTLIKER